VIAARCTPAECGRCLWPVREAVGKQSSGGKQSSKEHAQGREAGAGRPNSCSVPLEQECTTRTTTKACAAAACLFCAPAARQGMSAARPDFCCAQAAETDGGWRAGENCFHLGGPLVCICLGLALRSRGARRRRNEAARGLRLVAGHRMHPFVFHDPACINCKALVLTWACVMTLCL